MLLVILVVLALVWPLMKAGARQWVLGYVLAYAAGAIAASYRRIDETGSLAARPHGPPDRAWNKLRIVPIVIIGVVLLAGPLYLVVAAFTVEAAPLVALVGMVVILILTILLRRLRCPACGRPFFGVGAYWADRCASCGAHRPRT